MNIYNFTLEELENYLVDNGFKKFNATQLIEWIYEKKEYDYEKIRLVHIQKIYRNFLLRDKSADNHCHRLRCL